MIKKKKINWKKRLENFHSTPEKEKNLNRHLRKVCEENPSAFREEIFKKLEQSLNTRSIH
mgnify:CR=1 FL=1